MPTRVTEFNVCVAVYARVEVPSHINLKPDEEGWRWWVRWNTLYYHEDGVIKEYGLGSLDYEGDYKRPGIDDVEEEEYEEIPEDIEEALEAWAEYQKKKAADDDEDYTDEWIAMMEHKLELYHEHQLDIILGK